MGGYPQTKIDFHNRYVYQKDMKGGQSMSLYNMVNGFNPACIFIMPLLGRRDSEYPRFRDCFVEDGKIAILTRVGGNNRDCGFGEEVLYEDPNFVSTYDDEDDSTYGIYLFNVPEKWKSDFDKILNKDLAGTSDEYKQYIKEFWPTIADKLDKFFNQE
jgi:hypothetical protein